MHHTCAIKRHTPEIANGISFDISIDEDPSLRIDSFAIIHLPGVSTKPVFLLQNYISFC